MGPIMTQLLRRRDVMIKVMIELNTSVGLFVTIVVMAHRYINNKLSITRYKTQRLSMHLNFKEGGESLVYIY